MENNVQEIVEDNKLQGELTVENVANLAGGEVKLDDIAAAQAAEEAQIHAEIASKKAGTAPTPVAQTPVASPQAVVEAPVAQAPAQPQTKAIDDYFGGDTPVVTDDGIDHSGKTVPVEAHIKLRREKQAAEARIAELEATQTAGVNAGAIENLQIDDDIPVEGKVVKQLLAKQKQDILGEVGNVLSQRDAQLAAAMAERSGKSGRVQSQMTARAKFADYDVAIQTAQANGVLFKSDIENAKKEENPGVALYLTAKLKLSALGIQIATPVKSPTKQTPAKPKEVTVTDKVDSDGEVVVPEAIQTAAEIFATSYGAKKTNQVT